MRVDNSFGFDYKSRMEFKDKVTKENSKLISESIQKRDQEIKKLFGTDEESKKKVTEAEEKRILRKLARGEKLTPKEMEKVKNIDPEKTEKATRAKQRKDQIERQLKGAKSAEEKQGILAAAQIEVMAASEANDTMYAELLADAVDKAKSNSEGRTSDDSGLEGLIGFDARA